MSQLTSAPTLSAAAKATPTDVDWHRLYRIGGVAVLLQLICLLISLAVNLTVGGEPTTASEYFTVLQSNRLVGLLRLDFTTLLLLALYPLQSFAIYAALKQHFPGLAALSTALALMSITLAIANHSAFSMIWLSDQYAAATSAAQQEQLLAAGTAVISADMWRSTGGFWAGVYLQGAYVLISLLMLWSRRFGRTTAYTGLLANGLDWTHLFINFVAPGVANAVLMIGGLFYLVWFPLLARDLLRLGETDTERTDTEGAA